MSTKVYLRSILWSPYAALRNRKRVGFVKAANWELDRRSYLIARYLRLGDFPLDCWYQTDSSSSRKHTTTGLGSHPEQKMEPVFSTERICLSDFSTTRWRKNGGRLVFVNVAFLFTFDEQHMLTASFIAPPFDPTLFVGSLFLKLLARNMSHMHNFCLRIKGSQCGEGLLKSWPEHSCCRSVLVCTVNCLKNSAWLRQSWFQITMEGRNGILWRWSKRTKALVMKLEMWSILLPSEWVKQGCYGNRKRGVSKLSQGLQYVHYNYEK